MKSPEQINEEVEFKKRFRGIPAHKIAMAMTRLQHGIDFSKCTKEMLAESWALRESRFGHSSMKNMTLDQIQTKITELYADRTTLHVPYSGPPPRTQVVIDNSHDQFKLWLLGARGDDVLRAEEVSWLWKAWQAGRKSF